MIITVICLLAIIGGVIALTITIKADRKRIKVFEKEIEDELQREFDEFHKEMED